MNNILCAPRVTLRIHPWRADNSHMKSLPHARALYTAIKVLFSLLVLAFPLGNLLHPSFTLAQSDGVGLARPISVTSEFVILPVNVSDSNGNFIRGLSEKNFHVYEDNRLYGSLLSSVRKRSLVDSKSYKPGIREGLEA